MEARMFIGFVIISALFVIYQTFVRRWRYNDALYKAVEEYGWNHYDTGIHIIREAVRRHMQKVALAERERLYPTTKGKTYWGTIGAPYSSSMYEDWKHNRVAWINAEYDRLEKIQNKDLTLPYACWMYVNYKVHEGEFAIGGIRRIDEKGWYLYPREPIHTRAS